jgi:hypothetical protein
VQFNDQERSVRTSPNISVSRSFAAYSSRRWTVGALSPRALASVCRQPGRGTAAAGEGAFLVILFQALRTA